MTFYEKQAYIGGNVAGRQIMKRKNRNFKVG